MRSWGCAVRKPAELDLPESTTPQCWPEQLAAPAIQTGEVLASQSVRVKAKVESSGPALRPSPREQHWSGKRDSNPRPSAWEELGKGLVSSAVGQLIRRQIQFFGETSVNLRWSQS